MRRILRYLAEPTFDEYYRLRTGGLKYDFIPDGVTSNALNRAREEGKLATADEMESVRYLWNESRKREGEPANSRIQAVALDTFKAAVTHTNSGKAMIVGPVSQGFTIATELRNPGFEYPVSVGALPMLFEFSFLARIDETSVRGPVLISLLWHEEAQDWVLNRLITDQWLPLQTLF